MLILGIETSCDETSAALVENGKTILTNTVFSQIEIHKSYNGVVPEIASRNHLIKIIDVLEESLGGRSLSQIDAVAVTNGPGLIGSLLIGLSAAKAISYTTQKPLIPVNHISAHQYAPHLFNDIEFPYISLVVSGGHTLLFQVNSFQDSVLIGSTIDDAIGEAFDKVAKVLKLGYPGGPVIDKLAKQGNPAALAEFSDMPYIFPDTKKDRYNFSYSGLKTAIAFRLKRLTVTEENIPHVAAVFQKAAIELLVRKTRNALQDFNMKRLVISGGVAANSFLRAEFDKLKNQGISVYTAPLEYCGDNAAMVAGRGYHETVSKEPSAYRNSLRTEVFSRLPFITKGKRIH